MTAINKLLLLGKGLNYNGWDKIVDILNESNIFYEIHHDCNSINDRYEIGILLGYHRIVPVEILAKAKSGFIVFHSSDLPKGRGFAPIYNTIVNGLPLTQTLCFAVEQVDSGNIISKAHYNLEGNELENEVRRIDDELTLRLLKDALPYLLVGQVKGCPQQPEKATWWSRRRPEDSMIDDSQPIKKLFNHLRALPPDAPAFFERDGRRYQIRLEAIDTRHFFDPARLTLERFYE